MVIETDGARAAYGAYSPRLPSTRHEFRWIHQLRSAGDEQVQEHAKVSPANSLSH